MAKKTLREIENEIHEAFSGAQADQIDLWEEVFGDVDDDDGEMCRMTTEERHAWAVAEFGEEELARREEAWRNHPKYCPPKSEELKAAIKESCRKYPHL